MTLGSHTIHPAHGSTHTTKRLGRGHGSGKGTMSGRGGKGQTARSGGKSRTTIRALRPTIMKAPKLRGFTSFQKKVETVTLTTVEHVAKHTKKITPATLYNEGVISRPTSLVKIVGTGALNSAVTVEGCFASKSALAAIEKAGGKMVF
jgi:large subunit ribosomal protein L15